MTRRPWTSAEDDRLQQLVEGGMHDDDAAAELGRSKQAVRLRRQRILGLDTARAPGRARQYDHREIGRLVEAGKSVSEIARHVGGSPAGGWFYAVVKEMRGLG